MAYDSVRAQLDKLLGPDRNGPLAATKVNKQPPDYRDSNICKHFLLGFCPNDLYIKQRSEPGSCRFEHVEAAKIAFENDLNSGLVREEKLRWMRALVNDCRSIIADEDRKIRGQARRLQDSYTCGGDLSGLMIRDFDTLKKLGMVSPNAKIRILSEIDNDDLMSDHDPTLPITFADPSSIAKKQYQPVTANHETNESKNASSTKPESQNSPGEVAHDQLPKVPENGKPSAGDESEDDDDDDDLDGFGLIKVIPADEKAKVDPEVSNGSKDDQILPAPSMQDVSAIDKPAKETETKDPKLSLSEKGKEEKHAIKYITDAKSSFGTADEKENEKGNYKNQHHPSSLYSQKHEPEEEKRAEPNSPVKESHQTQKSLSEPKSQSDSTVSNEGKEQPVIIMDKFYEAGVGPDGLLMLDRKQSKRVCACCGGYISLVDAESRLLSHYGGKSHHSLALLRSKAVELEALLAAEPHMPYERNAPFRGRRNERDSGRFRKGDDWRLRRDHRGGRGDRYSDKYNDRDGRRPSSGYFRDSRRGPSPPDRNRGSDDDHHKRYGARNGGDDYPNNRSYGRHDRYDGRRKRYRSPSPERGSRRSRRYY